VLLVQDWAEIRRLHRSERRPIKAIARVMGVSRNTVRAALRAASPPRYERAGSGSIVDEVEARSWELLKAWPDLPTTVIAERIGWTRSVRAAAPVAASGGGMAMWPERCGASYKAGLAL
jgi:transposase